MKSTGPFSLLLRKLLAGAVLIGVGVNAQGAPDASVRTVVLLHGLARSSASMNRLQAALEAQGYRVCNIDYPSTRHSVGELVSRQVRPAIEQCTPLQGQAISFVTHSMGGIVLRELQRSTPELNIDSAVMLGPPNHGSELVDRMGQWTLFRWINGPAGQQLGTAASSLPNQLGPVHFELGVIAGDQPRFEPFVGMIDGPSDGKVSVRSAQVEGMRDFLVLPVTHTTMMNQPETIRQTLHFLAHHRFDRRAVGSP